MTRETTGTLLIALGLLGCGERQPSPRADDQPDRGGGGVGDVGPVEGTKTPSPGGQTGDGGASGGSAGHGAGDTSELGGAGAANQAAEEEAATGVLEAAVTAAVGMNASVVNVSRLAGNTFVLRDCIGPNEPPCEGRCDTGSVWIDDPFDDDLSYDSGDAPFCPKLTLHFMAVDDALALIVEMPTQTFPYAEQLKLERRGDAWLARNIATSTRLALRNEDPEWATDYYKAALAAFAFADYDQDGEPDRVVMAATNSVEGQLLDGSKPLDTTSDTNRRLGWVNWGKAEGVAVSQGAAVPNGVLGSATNLTTHGVFINQPMGIEALHTPGYPPDRAKYGGSEDYVLLGGAHHVFALASPVRPDSVFYFENAQGERSVPLLMSLRPIEGYEAGGHYLHGLQPADGLSGDWDLVGEGTLLNGKPFGLRQPVTLLDDEGSGGAGGAGGF